MRYIYQHKAWPNFQWGFFVKKVKVAQPIMYWYKLNFG